MKLLSCHIENFGKLSGFSYVFEDGLNVLLEENGWGKSTFAAFLKVMFYGFEGENRRSEDSNERLRYRPWAGGTYGGSVTFTSGDRVYRMHRSFGARGKEDAFLLFDDETGLPSADFTEHIGEELFGIDRDSFTRTVFWSQQDHQTEATALIQAKIGDLSAEHGDLPDYDRSIRQLQREIDRLSPDRASGQIRKKEARAAVLEAEAARLPQLRQQLEECAMLKKSLSTELAQIRAEAREAAAKAAAEEAAARIAAEEAAARIAAEEAAARTNAEAASGDPAAVTAATRAARAALQAKLDASRRRLEMLRKVRRDTALAGHREREEYLRVGRERSRAENAAALALSQRAHRFQMFAVAAVFAAVILFVLIGTGALSLPFLTIGILLLGAGSYSLVRFRRVATEEIIPSQDLLSLQEEEAELRASLRTLSIRMKRAQVQMQEEQQTLHALKLQLRRLPADSKSSDASQRESLNAAPGSREGLNAAPGSREGLTAAPGSREGLNAAPGSREGLNAAPVSLQRAAAQPALYDRREEECRRRLLSAAQQADDLRDRIKESGDAAGQLQNLRKEIETLRLQYDTCVKTAAYLEQARTSFNSRYMNPFLRSFSQHYAMLTGESAENIKTDADFGITVMSEGLPRDPSLMSEGTRDLIGLCRRMAMIDAMYPSEKPFLVLDDPFSNLDDERVKGGMRFLHNASYEYQILYLTCHASRV